MNQIHCNVIKDLLPSYLEHLCSDETKELVESHLDGCASCRELSEKIAAAEFNTDESDRKQIDYMKKIKRRLIHKHLVLMGLLILFMIGGTAIVLSNLYRDTAVVPQVYQLVMPLLLFSAHYMLSDGRPEKKGKKWQLLLGSIGSIGICHAVLLSFTFSHQVQTGRYPMEPSKMGPFLNDQLLAAALIQLVLFFICCCAGLRTRTYYSIPMTIHITGSCLDLSLIFTLHRLDVVELWNETQSRIIVSFIIEGILMAAVLLLLERRDRMRAIG